MRFVFASTRSAVMFQIGSLVCGSFLIGWISSYFFYYSSSSSSSTHSSSVALSSHQNNNNNVQNLHFTITTDQQQQRQQHDDNDDASSNGFSSFYNRMKLANNHHNNNHDDDHDGIGDDPSSSSQQQNRSPLKNDNDNADNDDARTSSSSSSSSTAASSSNSIKLFCMVLTSPKTHWQKAELAVKATWGRRCDKLVFISSQQNASLPSVACNCTEGYDFLWGKVKAGFVHVHQTYNNNNNNDNKFDWFLKADDDTYVIMENLKAQLARYDANKPLVLGRRISAYITEGYMAGGSGYVLSRTALRTLVENGLLKDTDKRCRRKRERGVEDVEMGMCLHALSVSFVDTRDPEDNLETFIPHDPTESLTVRHNTSNFWLHNFNYYKTFDDGPKCCSNRPVSFHRLDAAMMQTLEYFVYRFQRIH